MGEGQESGTDTEGAGATPAATLNSISLRDIVNFLRGRNVLVAREVDFLCNSIRKSPGAKTGLTQFFSAAANNNKFTEPTSPPGLALLQTIQKPEFREVKDFFQNFLGTLQQSMNALEKNNWLNRQSVFSFDKDGTVKFNPDASEILICFPGFMDPIVALRHMKPVSPETMQNFETEVLKEENRLLRVQIRDNWKGTDQYSKEIEKISPAPFSFILK